MRESILIIISVLTWSACNNNVKNNNEQAKTEETTAVGGDKDEHGCLVSAGETWSQLKEDCVQIFEEGQRLNPIETQKGEAIISAFVLFNDDRSEAELFLADIPNSTILKTSDQETFENGIYKFDTKDSSLYIDGAKAYSAEAVK